MNEAHLHLLVNHVPIVGGLISICILLAGLLRGNASVLRVGLWVLIGSAALGFVAMQTGEGAEEIVEHLPGVSHTIIHEHEEASELATWVLLAAGALGAFTLWKSHRQESLPRGLGWATLAAALVGLLLMVRAGLLGGEIMHPETRQTIGADSPAHREHEAHGEHGHEER